MTSYKIATDKFNNYTIKSDINEEKAYTWEEAVEQLKLLSEKRTSMFEENLKDQ